MVAVFTAQRRPLSRQCHWPFSAENPVCQKIAPKMANAASYLLMAGVNLRTLADILGHSTMQMVQRYTHLLDDHKLRAIDRVEQLGQWSLIFKKICAVILWQPNMYHKNTISVICCYI